MNKKLIILITIIILIIIGIYYTISFNLKKELYFLTRRYTDKDIKELVSDDMSTNEIIKIFGTPTYHNNDRGHSALTYLLQPNHISPQIEGMTFKFIDNEIIHWNLFFKEESEKHNLKFLLNSKGLYNFLDKSYSKKEVDQLLSKNMTKKNVVDLLGQPTFIEIIDGNSIKFLLSFKLSSPQVTKYFARTHTTFGRTQKL